MLSTGFGSGFGSSRKNDGGLKVVVANSSSPCKTSRVGLGGGEDDNIGESSAAEQQGSPTKQLLSTGTLLAHLNFVGRKHGLEFRRTLHQLTLLLPFAVLSS